MCERNIEKYSIDFHTNLTRSLGFNSYNFRFLKYSLARLNYVDLIDPKCEYIHSHDIESKQKHAGYNPKPESTTLSEYKS